MLRTSDQDAIVNSIRQSNGLIVYSVNINYCYNSFTQSHRHFMKEHWGADISVGSNILEMIPALQRKKMKTHLDRALKGENFNDIQSYLKDGSQHLESRFEGIRDEFDNVVGVLIYSVDVANHLDVPFQLKKAQDRLKIALSSGKTGVWEWNINTDKIYWTDEVYSIFNVDRDSFEVNFESYKSLIHPDDLYRLEKAIHETLETQSDYYIEHRLKNPKGPVQWLRSHAKIKFDENGVPVHLVGTVHDITNQKQKSRKHDLLSLVVSSTINIVLLLDEHGNIEWVNPAFKKITGYGYKEVIGLNPTTFLHGEKSDKAATAVLNKAIKNKQHIKGVEVINYTKAGLPYWVAVEMQPIRDDDNKLVQFVVLHSDISEKKRREAELKESENRFRNIVQSSPMGLFMYELQNDGRLILIETNRAADEILKVETSKLIGLTIEEAFPALADTDIPTYYRKAASEGVAWNDENVQYQDQQIMGAYQVHCFQAGQNRAAVLFLDITEKKKAEKEKRDWQVRYELVTQASGQIIYDYDTTEGTIIWTGNTMEVLGFSNQEMGHVEKWAELVHPEDREEITDKLEKAMAALSKFEVVYRFSTASGDYKILSDRGFFFHDDAQNVRMIGIMEDITLQKEAELSLIQKNRELIKANAELDRFVYSASHDLRAPIASLLGLIEVARLEQSDDTIEAIFEKQERSLLKLDNFIKDIVDYSRNSRVQVEYQVVDFQLLLEETFEQLNFLEHFSKLNIDIAVSAPSSFTSDPRRLRMIFNNIISNAIKYADIKKEKPSICVTVTSNAEKATIIFKDNGEGINSGDIDKLFDMFYRASHNSSGSGLGLYIVKEVLQRLKGSINVESKLHEGTTFTITIPNQAEL